MIENGQNALRGGRWDTRLGSRVAGSAPRCAVAEARETEAPPVSKLNQRNLKRLLL
ncbi:hypothetical protein OG257_06590 [Streptomyces sp. NBC_00683]|uniref:hypothetical protein n=1 Tax=Streptomyces sp. NBC_00683 TaxID=2903670 RepID=UPI002E360F11|nr:hypothetical protein [Streptomyces sp. NBC_00683]